MKKIICGLIIAVLAIAPAIAGSIPLLGAGKPTSGAPPPGFSLIQSNSGSSNAATTSATSLGSATTAGNEILIFAQASATISTPAGFTSRSPQVNTQGFYLFEKLTASGDATDTPNLSIGGAANTTWVILEYSGISAYDTSTGSNVGFGAGASPQATPSITPASGNRLVMAAVGVSTIPSGTFNPGDPTGWTNSFSSVLSVLQPGPGDSLALGVASRQVVGNGATTFSTAASYTITTGGGQGNATIIASYAIP